MVKIPSEPVRAYLYTVLTAVVAMIVGTGIVTEQWGVYIIAVATAILGIGGVEAARSKVTPTGG